jgi:hypothetical protein
MAVEQLRDPVREFLARSLSGLHPASFIRTLGANMKKDEAFSSSSFSAFLLSAGAPIGPHLTSSITKKVIVSQWRSIQAIALVGEL